MEKHMRLIGKISGDLGIFSRTVSLKTAAGVLRIWIVVLGQGNARFFEIEETGIKHIGEAVSIATLKTPALITEKFYTNLASWLHEALEENPFDRLLVVTTEPLLKLWRKSLGHAVACRIIGEVRQDLGSLGVSAVEAELKKIVWD
jgi:Protein required for attachment to host cells